MMEHVYLREKKSTEVHLYHIRICKREEPPFQKLTRIIKTFQCMKETHVLWHERRFKQRRGDRKLRQKSGCWAEPSRLIVILWDYAPKRDRVPALKVFCKAELCRPKSHNQLWLCHPSLSPVTFMVQGLLWARKPFTIWRPAKLSSRHGISLDTWRI